MSAQPETNISHQALRKSELRILTNEFEQRTLHLLKELERADIGVLQRQLTEVQLGGRFEYLARLQTMDLTQTSIDWSDMFLAWKQTQVTT